MAAKNRITRQVNKDSVFESAQNLLTTQSFDQGDLMYYDAGGGTPYIRKQTAGDTGASFLGIAEDTVVSGKLKYPYSTDVDASQASSDVHGPAFGVIAKLVSKTSDAWVCGSKVYPYPTGGTYHVTSASGGLVVIGVYQGPTIASAAAGQEIEVYLKQTYL